MNSKYILVAYGSQTGNAESIAQDFCETLKENDFNAKVMTLNATKSVNIQEEVSVLVIGTMSRLCFVSVLKNTCPVCSTTGNGDPPENADSFWRTVKKRTTKDTFLGVSYCVLALGDTNYDKFCHMGKSIDKRCAELGGVRVADLVCADEATNLEEQVTLWQNQTLSTLQRLRSEGDEGVTIVAQNVGPTQDES